MLPISPFTTLSPFQTMPTINKLAILSGALGATASLIAKLALSPDSPIPNYVQSTCLDYVSDDSANICPIMALLSRGACLLLMIGLNAGMMSYFLDGMNESGSVAGTSLSTAANFSCSVSYWIGMQRVHKLRVQFAHIFNSWINERLDRRFMGQYFFTNMFQ